MASGPTGSPQSVTLETVRTSGEIRDNIRRFNRELTANVERVEVLVRQTTYWVVDTDEETFGPSKFVGFRSMTFDRYESALAGRSTGAQFDGGVTHRAIEAVLDGYSSDSRLTERLTRWCERAVGAGSLEGTDVEKWRFAKINPARRYWSLLCNPDRFAGLEAVSALDELVWTVDRGAPQPGDRILVWQAKGSGDRRGVIALGEVTAGLAVLPSPPEENRFWRGPIIGPSERIRFRVLPSPGLPLWEDGNTPWLSDLAVARARGGNIFTVEPEQWHAVLELATEGRGTLAQIVRPSRGQGFSLNPAARRAVELHAQAMAEDYFLGLGYEVDDVSPDHPYDLHCTDAVEELHVEVKGTTGEGGSVFLTRNEVEHARQNRERMVLVIVHHIELDSRETTPVAFGGDMRVIRPWDVDQGSLSPVQYQHSPAID